MVGLAGADGSGHLVVDFKDRVFRAVGAEGLEVFLLHDREGFHDVARRVTGRRERGLQGVAGVAGPLVGCAQVEVEEGCIEFGSQQEATLRVPHERWPRMPAVHAKRFKIPRRARQFDDAGEEPCGDRPVGLPWCCGSEERW